MTGVDCGSLVESVTEEPDTILETEIADGLLLVGSDICEFDRLPAGVLKDLLLLTPTEGELEAL